MTLILFLLVSGTVGLLGSLVVVEDQEESFHLAWEAITGNSVSRN
jgi:hypothetical protein